MFHRIIAGPSRSLAICAALTALLTQVPVAASGGAPSDDAAIVHAVGRLTFGATAGDLARARAMGLGAWIESQLHPSRIPDAGLDARLASLTTIALPSDVLAREYFAPARRERAERIRNRTADEMNGTVGAGAPDAAPPQPPEDSRPRSEAQRRERLVLLELAQAKILRAVYSDRQLEELLVDFWFNHFNVFAGKGQTRVYVTAYERDAVRPYVLGRFRDLLGATAKSPAMLFYLDNWLSRAPEGARTLVATRDTNLSGRPGAARRARLAARGEDPAATTEPRAEAALLARRSGGLNENYARELLELHTLGVDGGYTQRDIVEVARAFTGWTIDRPRAAFRFVPAMHDSGEKTVLGRTIPAGGGNEDGERVLDILAEHPSTARFIASKLARRFVADQPPESLVSRAAARFQDTRGDLREVVRLIVTSPEFFAADARLAKVKTPFEFVTSALRVTGAVVQQGLPLVRALRDLGMPLYFCQPPTGYDDLAGTWVSSGALVGRMNFALELASKGLRGVGLPAVASRDLDALGRDLARDALHGRASESTLSTLARATTPEQVLALAIGSPEFQRK